MPALAGLVARGLESDDPRTVVPEVTGFSQGFTGIHFTADDAQVHY
jgi:hypothetical protein